MRDVLVLISFDTVQFITTIKVRANHKIVSNIWNPCWVHTISHCYEARFQSKESGFIEIGGLGHPCDMRTLLKKTKHINNK